MSVSIDSIIPLMTCRERQVNVYILCKIKDEPDNQRQVRERRLLDMYRGEKELLELRAGQHEESLKGIDQDILDLINKKATGQGQKLLIDW